MKDKKIKKSFNRFRIGLAVIILLLASSVVKAQLKYLQQVSDIPPHPRILLFAGEEQQIKANVAAEPAWAKIHQSILEGCDRIMTLPVCEHLECLVHFRAECGMPGTLSTKSLWL